jgi:hypothetical protein
MGRKSAENISGSLWRAGNKPPAPPADMSKEAKAEWLEITRDRPADYFRKSNFSLLRSYCELTVSARRALGELEGLDPSGPRYAAAVHTSTKLSTSLLGYATKLRLFPSHEIDRKSRHQDERGQVGDPLLGGFAVQRAPLSRRAN